jgi:hypothetical protein
MRGASGSRGGLARTRDEAAAERRGGVLLGSAERRRGVLLGSERRRGVLLGSTADSPPAWLAYLAVGSGASVGILQAKFHGFDGLFAGNQARQSSGDFLRDKTCGTRHDEKRMSIAVQ